MSYREIVRVSLPEKGERHRIDSEAKHFVEFNGKPVSSVLQERR